MSSAVLGFEDGEVEHVTVHPDMESPQVAVRSDVPGFGTIVSMDIAAQFPLVAVCRDGRVCVLNYASNREVTWQGDEPTSVAVHPFGYIVAVGFVDRLRIFHVLVDDLRLTSEFKVTHQRCVIFSHGGQYLAAATGKVVQIYATRTMTKTVRLIAPALVTGLCFDLDDHKLIVCTEVDICEWTTHGWMRTHDLPAGMTFPAAISSGVTYLTQNAMLCCVKGPEVEEMHLPPDVWPLAVCYSRTLDTLFMGTSNGELWVLPSGRLQKNCIVKVHEGGFIFVKVSGDGHVVTVGEDGSIRVLGVTGLLTSWRFGVKDSPDLVMERRSVLQTRTEEIERLRLDNIALHAKHAEVRARLEGDVHREAAEWKRTDEERIAQLRVLLEKTDKKVQCRERCAKEALSALEAQNIQHFNAVESSYDSAISRDASALAQLSEAVVVLRQRINIEQEDSNRRLEYVRHRLQKERAVTLEESEEELARITDIYAFAEHRFRQTVVQETEMYSLEVADHTQRLTKEHDDRVYAEYYNMKSTERLRHDLSDAEHKRNRTSKSNRESSELMQALMARFEELVNGIAAKKAERCECEATIWDRELQLGEQKTEMSTLNKFKVVLDFGLREIALASAEKDCLLQQIHEQVHHMETNFEDTLATRRVLFETLEQVSIQHKARVAELDLLKELLKEKEQRYQKLSDELRIAVDDFDSRKWPELLDNLAQNMNTTATVKDVRYVQEPSRQVNHREKQVDELSCKSHWRRVVTKKFILTQSDENTALIADVAELRIETGRLEAMVKSLSSSLKEKERTQKASRDKRRRDLMGWEDSRGDRGEVNPQCSTLSFKIPLQAKLPARKGAGSRPPTRRTIVSRIPATIAEDVVDAQIRKSERYRLEKKVLLETIAKVTFPTRTGMETEDLEATPVSSSTSSRVGCAAGSAFQAVARSRSLAVSCVRKHARKSSTSTGCNTI